MTGSRAAKYPANEAQGRRKGAREDAAAQATGSSPTTLEDRVAAAILKAAGEPPANFTDYTPGEGQMIYARCLARAAMKVIEEAISL